MSEDLREILFRTTVATFEELGFVVPAETPEAEDAAPVAGLTAEVRFAGSRRGRLALAAENRLLAEVAANMTGAEEAISEATRRDALGEIANVLCGNLLPALKRPGERFKIEAPVILAAMAPAPGAVRVVLDFDTGRAEARLELE